MMHNKLVVVDFCMIWDNCGFVFVIVSECCEELPLSN